MFDTYLNPQRTQTQFVTREVHEHRAPTDESVKLLREMEQKARDQITKSIRLESNNLKANIYQYLDPLSMDKVYRIVADINGKRVESEIRTPEYLNFDEQVALIHKGISDMVANHILLDVSSTLVKFLK